MYQMTCMIASLLSLLMALRIYREDQRFHNICVDSMIERIRELEGDNDE